MSSRTLRKVYNLGNSLHNDIAIQDDKYEEEDEIAFERKPKQNTFSLLAVTLDSPSESEIKEDDNETEPENEVEITGTKKKKKKKKKKSHKNYSKGKSSEDYLDVDELGNAIKEVKVSNDFSSVTNVHDTKQRVKSSNLLAIEYKLLNPDNEMRKIFGSKVIQNEQRKKIRGRSSIKSNYLVSPKSEWFPVTKQGISMSIRDRLPDHNLFVFEHSLSYQKLQLQFLDAIQTSRHDFISTIINKEPYHIDSLLILSDLYKMSEDFQMAEDMVQRALHSYEAAFHPMFNMSTGLSRLNYKQQENRGFFISLFKHLTFVAQKGCNRTALELSKLLLSLDPETDPLAVLLMIDTFALKSKEYNFLITIYEQWKSSKNLLQLPNFAYSVPLAFYLNAEDNPVFMEKANELLCTALLDFPGILMPLLDKCGVQPDEEVLNCELFSNAVQKKQSPALKRLVDLFIIRNHATWKDPQIISWLEKNTKNVINSTDINTHINGHLEMINLRYQGMPRNIKRHFFISDIKDLSVGSDDNMPTYNHDPFPPVDTESGYSQKRQQRSNVTEQDSILSTFFRSIFPTYQASTDTNNSEEGAVGNAELGNFVLDSIRNFLADFNIPGLPADAQDDAGEMSEPD